MKFIREVSESYVESNFIKLDKFKKAIYDAKDDNTITFYKVMINLVEDEINNIIVEV